MAILKWGFPGLYAWRNKGRRGYCGCYSGCDCSCWRAALIFREHRVAVLAEQIAPRRLVHPSDRRLCPVCNRNLAPTAGSGRCRWHFERLRTTIRTRSSEASNSASREHQTTVKNKNRPPTRGRVRRTPHGLAALYRGAPPLYIYLRWGQQRLLMRVSIVTEHG